MVTKASLRHLHVLITAFSFLSLTALPPGDTYLSLLTPFILQAADRNEYLKTLWGNREHTDENTVLMSGIDLGLDPKGDTIPPTVLQFFIPRKIVENMNFGAWCAHKTEGNIDDLQAIKSHGYLDWWLKDFNIVRGEPQSVEEPKVTVPPRPS